MRFSFFLLLLIFVGCKKPAINKTEAEFNSTEEILFYFNKNKLDFNTLEIKGKCDYEDANRSMGFNVIIRMQKDEKIWVSGRLLGIEGVRGLITPDSVFMVNRLERTYIAEPVSRLEDFVSISADFSALQNILIGDILLNSNSYTIEQVEDKLILANDKAEYQHELTFNNLGNQLIQQWIYLKQDQIDSNIEYAEYQELEQGKIPTDYIVKYNGNEEITVEMKYNQIKVNEKLSFPFSIPSSYRREE